MMLAPRKRVVSGIVPSGELHVGNWLGAVRAWEQFCDAGAYEAFFLVADAHAIASPQEPAELRARILEMAMDLVACGIDPARCALFVQSDVREHTELAWYLASITPMSDLARLSPPFDESFSEEQLSTARFAYPVLMSADLLLYKAEIVPAGEDQRENVEHARETARRWNFRFGDTFPEPMQVCASKRIIGIDGAPKMSKSKGNSIGMFDHDDDLWRKLKGALTDPERVHNRDPGRPEHCNVFTMHAALSPAKTVDEVRAHCMGGTWGCFDCKRVLHEGMARALVPLREKRAALREADVRDALSDGASTARRVARETLLEVRDALGLGSHAAGASS